VKPVQARRFPIAVAQRLDLLVELPPEAVPSPSSPCSEGTTARTGVISQAPARRSRAWPQQARGGPGADLRLEASLIPTQAWRSERPIGVSS